MERYVDIACADLTLSGILHEVEDAATDQAVLVVVGGPQYRVGSHRMFVVLARALADAGVPVLRFDFRGMGDSGGEFPGFDNVSDDIRAACDALQQACPGCTRITIVGLCDGASAAAIYADEDARVDRLVLLNPWVHTEAGEAKAFVWHYYPRRLLRAEFWRGLVTGKVNIGKAARGVLSKLKLARGGSSGGEDIGFIPRMHRGLAGFDGDLHILLSDTDLTAAEFKELVKSDPDWARVTGDASVHTVAQADHTFSSHDAMQAFVGRSVAAITGSAP